MVGFILGSVLMGCGQDVVAVVIPTPTVAVSPTPTLHPLAARQATHTMVAATNAPIQTAFAQDERATALAQPAARYLTLREAFALAGIRERGTMWAADAVLVDAGLGYRGDGLYAGIAANDGTGRLWVYTFASARLKQTLVLAVRDGVVERQYADERSYRDLFVGTLPVDIPLESQPFLDSDQARVLFLTFGDLWKTLDRPNHTFRLSSLPNAEATDHPIYWWMQDAMTNVTLLDPVTGATFATTRKQRTTSTPPAKTLLPLVADPVATVQPTPTRPWSDAAVVQAFWPTPRAGRPIRVIGLYASDGIDYWQYRDGRWDRLRRAETDRIPLLRMGFPIALVP
ncbi:hypothetical protein [Herpetosiphon geysericola]|nr:hypothetical protein [Herpetosiphon geysericola]